jgi:hypothetical protein
MSPQISNRLLGQNYTGGNMGLTSTDRHRRVDAEQLGATRPLFSSNPLLDFAAFGNATQVSRTETVPR